jgi:hypothetical protein
MTDETRARFDRLLLAAQEADRRLRACETFKQFVLVLTHRHARGELSDQDFIAALRDASAYEWLDDAPDGRT